MGGSTIKWVLILIKSNYKLIFNFSYHNHSICICIWKKYTTHSHWWIFWTVFCLLDCRSPPHKQLELVPSCTGCHAQRHTSFILHNGWLIHWVLSWGISMWGTLTGWRIPEHSKQKLQAGEVIGSFYGAPIFLGNMADKLWLFRLGYLAFCQN